MNEIGDALAIALEAIEEHAGEITDPILARRVANVRTQLEELQLALDDAA